MFSSSVALSRLWMFDLQIYSCSFSVLKVKTEGQTVSPEPWRAWWGRGQDSSVRSSGTSDCNLRLNLLLREMMTHSVQTPLSAESAKFNTSWL